MASIQQQIDAMQAELTRERAAAAEATRAAQTPGTCRLCVLFHPISERLGLPLDTCPETCPRRMNDPPGIDDPPGRAEAIAASDAAYAARQAADEARSRGEEKRRK